MLLLTSRESMLSKIPVTWNLDEVAALDFKKDHHKDLEMIDRYIKSGHESSKMIIFNYWEPNPMPAGICDVKQFFPELDHAAVAVHKTPPGCYLPLHHDLYGKYRETHGLHKDRSITRVIIMLTHSEPGQMLQVDEKTYGQWTAGQVFSWQDQTSHAIYNFSMSDRFAVQITGVMS